MPCYSIQKTKVTLGKVNLERMKSVAVDEAKPAPVPTQSQREISRGAIGAANRYIDWHTLLSRVYDLDSLVCPRCGGQLRMIAVLTDPEPIRAILESMGLRSTPPVPARARSPTLFDDSQLAAADVV